MAHRLHWDRDGRDWPHREHSRFVDAGGLRWHVQQWAPPHAGAPFWLLLHGTGASTHSWRGLAPLLAAHAGLIAVDLPGHGFSGAAPGDEAGMHGMARGVTALLAALGVQPDASIGHSAGAAIAIRRALSGAAPQPVVGLNAALFPLPGLAGPLFSPVAKLLALNPLVPHFFARRAHNRSVVDKLLDSTGSKLDDAGTALYRRLVTNPGHVAGALAMVSRWNLRDLAAELPQLKAPLHLVVAEKDGTVPPAAGRRAQALVAGSTLTTLPALGHLAHEEKPAEVAALIRRLLQA